MSRRVLGLFLAMITLHYSEDVLWIMLARFTDVHVAVMLTGALVVGGLATALAHRHGEVNHKEVHD